MVGTLCAGSNINVAGTRLEDGILNEYEPDFVKRESHTTRRAEKCGGQRVKAKKNRQDSPLPLSAKIHNLNGPQPIEMLGNPVNQNCHDDFCAFIHSM